MTIYFIRPIADKSKVKVGHTTDLQKRLQCLSCEFDGGVELIGQCDGGVEVERAFHAIFEEYRIEGEWFRWTNAVAAVVEPFERNVSGKRIWSRIRAVEATGATAIDDDKTIARDLLQQLMSFYGAIHFGIALRKAYDELAAINPLWTSRRVRAIWERQARRIDHFEIRDLSAAISMWSQTTRAIAVGDV